MSQVTISNQRPSIRATKRVSLLWVMIAVALLLHVVLLVVLSPSMFRKSADSPEAIYERGETALAAGQYTDAMDLFQKVLDLQPKLAPVFEKAAEQHRVAERLNKQQLARVGTTQPAGSTSGEVTPPALTTPQLVAPSPTKVNTPSTRPAGSTFVPPELAPRP